MALRKFLASTPVAEIYRRIRYPYQCTVCRARFVKFQPINQEFLETRERSGNKYDPNDCETLNLENYHCPMCHAVDRERLYALFLEQKLKECLGSTKLKLLDIAPAKPLQRFIKNQRRIEYRSADLFQEGVDDQVDIQDMQVYADASFDIFVCSHVLEHVPDDMAAMKELRRVLRPGGWGILMVPLNLKVESIDEDPSITDPNERRRRFGQDDHVRMYSKSAFFERIVSVGFICEEFGLEDFGRGKFKQAGITEGSKLYVVS